MHGSSMPGSEQQRLVQSQLTSCPDGMILDVWAANLEEEFERIRQIIVDYPYISMDTEFPGVVARPIGSFRSNTEFYYQTLRCNVNLLKIIQLGVTFSDEKGNHPPGTVCWQFNFKFNLSDDIYAQDSIDLLADSGIDFAKFAKDGIEVNTFAELLLSSGLVLDAGVPVTWLSFHAGYDYGYLIKILTDAELPAEENDFFDLMDTYFPNVFDIKFILKQTGGRISDTTGLSRLGDMLAVHRIGPAHQAGSDSLLTAHCFFKLKDDYFPGDLIHNFCGVLYGLGKDKDSTQPWRMGASNGSETTNGINMPQTTTATTVNTGSSDPHATQMSPQVLSLMSEKPAPLTPQAVLHQQSHDTILSHRYQDAMQALQPVEAAVLQHPGIPHVNGHQPQSMVSTIHYVAQAPPQQYARFPQQPSNSYLPQSQPPQQQPQLIHPVSPPTPQQQQQQQQQQHRVPQIPQQVVVSRAGGGLSFSQQEYMAQVVYRGTQGSGSVRNMAYAPIGARAVM
ncbi:putative CCR4-associated factor 1-like protein 6 [Diplonema papillatum]|nr:putative CCR4-associated factor 1-like protein 6 [Diplonema papillatum]